MSDIYDMIFYVFLTAGILTILCGIAAHITRSAFDFWAMVLIALAIWAVCININNTKTKEVVRERAVVYYF